MSETNAEIIELRKDGLAIVTIANQIGISPNRVRNIIAASCPDLLIHRNVCAQYLARNRLIVEYIKQGKTQAEIANVFGISTQRVGQIVARECPEYNGYDREFRPIHYNRCFVCEKETKNDKFCSARCAGVFKRKSLYVEGLRKCTKCGELKPESEYYKVFNKDILMARCKKCHNSMVSKRAKERRQSRDVDYIGSCKAASERYRMKNAEEIKRKVSLKLKKRYRTDPEYRAKVIRRSKEYYHRKARNG